MKNVSFGLFDWIDRGGRPLHQLYSERLQLLEAADDAGFYGYHIAEHHGTPLGMAPSPSVYLAAAAQRTKKIRLGPLTYVVPLYNPLRLIEEIAMLDQLSNGRLELGVGRGASMHEVACYGFDPSQTRAIYNEAMEVLVAGMTRPRLTYKGKYFQYDDVPMEIAPMQKPYPPLWYPTSNIESIEYAAREGFHFAGLGPAVHVRRQVDRYREIWQTSRKNPARLNAHVEDPKLGILRMVCVAESDDAAAVAARRAHADWYRAITKLWHEHDDRSMDKRFSWETAVEHETVLFGSAPRVREQIERLVETSGCNYVLCVFAWGTLTYEQSVRSMRLFAAEVMGK